ncbi:MAG: YtxH domain-containing protein [Bradymonadaceae bacterium]
MDFKKILNDMNKQVSSTYDSGMDTFLDRMGLEQKRSTMELMLPMLGVFGAGIAVGASLGLLFAPKRGDELRGDLRHRIDDLRERMPENFDELRGQAKDTLENVKEEVGTKSSGQQPLQS